MEKRVNHKYSKDQEELIMVEGSKREPDWTALIKTKAEFHDLNIEKLKQKFGYMKAKQRAANSDAPAEPPVLKQESPIVVDSRRAATMLSLAGSVAFEGHICSHDEKTILEKFIAVIQVKLFESCIRMSLQELKGSMVCVKSSEYYYVGAVLGNLEDFRWQPTDMKWDLFSSLYRGVYGPSPSTEYVVSSLLPLVNRLIFSECYQLGIGIIAKQKNQKNPYQSMRGRFKSGGKIIGGEKVNYYTRGYRYIIALYVAPSHSAANAVEKALQGRLSGSGIFDKHMFNVEGSQPRTDGTRTIVYLVM